VANLRHVVSIELQIYTTGFFFVFCICTDTTLYYGAPDFAAFDDGAPLRWDRVIDDEVRLARAELTRAALQVLDSEEVSEAQAAVRREYEARLASGTAETQTGTNGGSELALIQSRAIVSSGAVSTGRYSRIRRCSPAHQCARGRGR
jgi:hypothetical protein